MPVDLQHDAPQDLSVTVRYGNAGKELDNAYISLVKKRDSKPYMKPEVVGKQQACSRKVQTTYDAYPKKKPDTSPLIVEDIYIQSYYSAGMWR